MPIQLTGEGSGTEWLNRRKGGIGGSDTVTLMGAGQYDDETPYFVWLKKVEGYSVPMNAAMQRGIDLEPIVCKHYADRTGYDLRETGLWMHDKHERVIGSPDRLVYESPDSTEPIGGFEAKTTLARSAKHYDPEVCPARFEWQVRHYMAIMNVDWWDVACLIVDTWETMTWRVWRDHDKESALLAAATEFWDTYVEPEIAPEPDFTMTPLEVAVRYRTPNGKTLDLDPDSPEGRQVDDVLAERALLGAPIKNAEKRIKEIDRELKGIAGEYEEVLLGSARVYSWKPQSREGLDRKRLWSEYPEIGRRYRTESTFRVLRVS